MEIRRIKTLKAFLFLVFALGILGLSSCYVDKEETLYPKTKSNCDTANVTYNGSVKPLISQYCLACHNTSNNASLGGNLNLDGYINLSNAIKNERPILKSIQHAADVSAMPKNSPKLSDCNIAIIQKWINAGMLNN